MSNSPKVERKLAAIVFTDIVDFTEITANDQPKALNLLNQQREILKPLVESYGGKWLKEIGDGLLLIFDTVNDAVKCSIDIQNITNNINSLNLRIGIHQGEIVLQGDDVIGDDVNIASRIEPFSATGGIAISNKVNDAIIRENEFETEYIGKPKLKGVSQEVKVYCIVSHQLPKTDVSQVSAKLEKEKSKYNIFTLTGGVLTAIGIVFWLYISIFDVSFADINEVPSVAILPLDNKGDEEDEFYAYGISSDLISDVISAGLIRVASLKNIEKIKDYNKLQANNLASKLFVRYIAEGTLWKRDSIFQLSMELYDTKTEKIIWSERWQKNWNQLPIIRDLLAENILENLKVVYTPNFPSYAVNPDAYELYLKAKHKYIKRKNADDIEIVRGLLNKAIELDNNLLAAKNLIGTTYLELNDLEKSLLYFTSAFEEAEKNGDIREMGSSLYNMGIYSIKKGNRKTSLTYFEKALKIYEDLNDKNGIGEIYIKYADYYWSKNDLETAVEYDKKSLKLYKELGDLRGVGINLVGIGIYYGNTKKDYKEALNYYEKSLKIFEENGFRSNMPYSLTCIGQTYSSKGDLVKALKYYNRVINIEEELGIYKYTRRSLLEKITNYTTMGNFEQSYNLSKISLEKFKNHDDKISIVYTLINLGIIQYYDGNYNKSLDYFEQSKQIQEEFDLSKFSFSIKVYISLIYKHLNKNIEFEKIHTLIKETESVGYELNLRLYELFEEKSYLETAYNQIQEKVDAMDDELKQKFLTYPIPKQIIEEYKKILL